MDRNQVALVSHDVLDFQLYRRPVALFEPAELVIVHDCAVWIIDEETELARKDGEALLSSFLQLTQVSDVEKVDLVDLLPVFYLDKHFLSIIMIFALVLFLPSLSIPMLPVLPFGWTIAKSIELCLCIFILFR